MTTGKTLKVRFAVPVNMCFILEEREEGVLMNLYKLKSTYPSVAVAVDGVVLTKNNWITTHRELSIPTNVLPFVDVDQRHTPKAPRKPAAEDVLAQHRRQAYMDEIFAASPLYDEQELENMTEQQLKDITNALCDIPEELE